MLRYGRGGLAAVLLAAVIFLCGCGASRLEKLEDQVRAAVAASDGTQAPVDFAALQAENSDICGWLYIPGTEISGPLLQSADDDTFYLTHGSAKEEDAAGALFTESAYNAADFSDTATVVYGKGTQPPELFGSLQEAYSSAAGVADHSEVVIYLPGETLRYTVFAAVPFRSYHLLYYFHFDVADRYQAFLDTAASVRSIDAYYDHALQPTPGEPLLILSTTRKGDPENCYLVLAKGTER